MVRLSETPPRPAFRGSLQPPLESCARVTSASWPFHQAQRPGTVPLAAAAVALGLGGRRRGGASATAGPCSAGAGTWPWRRRGLPMAAPPFNQGYYQTGLAGWRRPALPPLAQGLVGVGPRLQLQLFWGIVRKGHRSVQRGGPPLPRLLQTHLLLEFDFLPLRLTS